MAGVRIRIDDFEDGVLPGICVGSGVETSRNYRVTATSKPPAWIWLFVFAFPWGLVVSFVLAATLRKSTPGFLPYTEPTRAKIDHRIRTSAWAAVGGAASLVVSIPLLTTPGFRTLGILLAAGGAVAALVGYFLWLNPPGSVGATLDSTGRWIVLDNVSSAFAFAYEQQEARRRAARRAGAADPTSIESTGQR